MPLRRLLISPSRFKALNPRRLHMRVQTLNMPKNRSDLVAQLILRPTQSRDRLRRRRPNLHVQPLQMR
jgi:hypothetical protein